MQRARRCREAWIRRSTGRRDGDAVRADGDALDLALHVVEVAAQHLGIGGRVPVRVDAGEHDLEHQLGTERAGEFAVALGEAGIVTFAGVELGHEVSRPQRPQRLQQVQGGPRMVAGHGQAHRRHPGDRPVVEADGDGRAAACRRRLGRNAGDGERDLLAQLLALGDRCRARAAPAGGHRSCRRRPSSCAGPPSRRCRPPCGRRRARPARARG